MSHEDNEKAAEMIQELLKKGFIRPSRSPCGTPMFLVSKPDGSKRMVIDYRPINMDTIRADERCRARASSARSTCAPATDRSA